VKRKSYHAEEARRSSATKPKKPTGPTAVCLLFAHTCSRRTFSVAAPRPTRPFSSSILSYEILRPRDTRSTMNARARRFEYHRSDALLCASSSCINEMTVYGFTRWRTAKAHVIARFAPTGLSLVASRTRSPTKRPAAAHDRSSTTVHKLFVRGSAAVYARDDRHRA